MDSVATFFANLCGWRYPKGHHTEREEEEHNEMVANVFNAQHQIQQELLAAHQLENPDDQR